ncbi:60S ribosomal protein L23a-like [Echinops telfairi]|uniref:60S ribosomal protein L23a-like n=1 Tax=Echinops telfairi TaxID=9371 RepID=A0AC55DKQ7_ECHTE|nr:60S ribosomal protein L23a-like [Echinops telfairi]
MKLGLFMKMALKAKKEAPAPLKTDAKAKVLKAKKAVLKGFQSYTHTHTNTKVTHLPTTQVLEAKKTALYPQKSTPRISKLDHCAIIKFPLTTESTIKKTEDNITLMFTVDVKADEYHIKQAVTAR